MFEVIYKFKDLQDSHVYESGDKFPHDDRKIPKKRINELKGKNNKIGQPLIKEVSVE